MGAKASTANSGNQSPSRARTFSTSSSSDVVSGSVASNVNGGASGFNFLRSIHGVDVTNDNRQRARSLSSVVPDIHHHPHNHHHTNHSNHSNMTIPTNSSNIQSLGVVGVQQLQMSSTSTEDSSNSSDNNTASAAMLNALGRVYTATSLPSHIWSLNGIKCPVCSKFILPDDIECHLVMCLTKPRLSYNEDVLNDAKGECVICLEELNAGDLIARLPCLCIYHKNCIDQWFEVNRSCPEHPSD